MLAENKIVLDTNQAHKAFIYWWKGVAMSYLVDLPVQDWSQEIVARARLEFSKFIKIVTLMGTYTRSQDQWIIGLEFTCNA